jgi:hypothetical protein
MLERYTSASAAYAFTTYDRQGPVDDPLSASDVLMANLLSLQLSARDVVPLFMDGDDAPQRLRVALDHALVSLRDARPFEAYESVTDLDDCLESLAVANEAAIPVKWWTAVVVSKVLHRRRPHIVPLIDSRVHAFWGTKRPQLVRAAMWEDIQANKGWLTELAATKTTPDGRPLSVLRLVDILVWMAD